MTAMGPQWRDVFDLIQASEARILEAVRDFKGVLDKHDQRIEALEDTALELKGSKQTATLFMRLPQKVVNLAVSSLTLVLTLIAVYAAMGKL